MKTINGYIIIEAVKDQGIQKNVMGGIATPSLKTLKVVRVAFDYEEENLKLPKGTKILVSDDLFKNNKSLIKLNINNSDNLVYSLIKTNDIVGILP